MPILLAEVAGSNAGSQLNTALQTNLAPSSLFSEFLAILPWVGGMVAVAFLVYEGKKLIKGSAKMKVRL